MQEGYRSTFFNVEFCQGFVEWLNATIQPAAIFKIYGKTQKTAQFGENST